MSFSELQEDSVANHLKTMTNNTTLYNGIAMDSNLSVINCIMQGENCTDQLIDLEVEQQYLTFEKYVRITVPIVFGLISVFGLVGNSLVIFVVLGNKQMRSTTNILIVSLAFADLIFIIICVPFTATEYVMPIWPFGDAWCKVVRYAVYVSVYVSIYTLVLMSLDRYLAVVHPVSSLKIRTKDNACIVVAITWVFFLLCHTPLLFQYGHYEYVYYGELRSACTNVKSIEQPEISKMFFASFLGFGYLLPLSLICVLYGLMLRRLLYGVVPGGGPRTSNSRPRKRVTRLVVIVVVVFAICWLPIQIIFMLQHFGNYSTSILSAGIQMVANCLAYMNSCVNPVIYTFLSETYRNAFTKLLGCDKVTYSPLQLNKANGIKGSRSDIETVNRCAQTQTDL